MATAADMSTTNEDAAHLPLQAQNSDPRPLHTATTTPEEKEEEDVTLKPDPPVKATVRRPSKQLPRLFIVTKRMITSTMPREQKEWYALPASSSLTSNNSTHAHHSSSPGLCSSLPGDLICKVTSFLDVRSLLHTRRCSRYLKDLASRNEAGWEGLCLGLWSDKVHVLPGLHPSSASAAAMVKPDFYMDAYQKSLRDATERQHVTIEELCYDPDNHTGTVWSFRFKESAGADWTNSDPWYNGLPCRKMVFLKDGSVRQYVPAAASQTINNNDAPGAANFRRSCSSTTEGSDSESLPELISPNFGNQILDAQQRQQQQQQPTNNDTNNQHNHQRHHIGHLVLPPVSMSWRFSTRPMDLPNRPHGSYLRFSVGGREVPTYSARRSPTGNWGFVIESCWGLYGSFELPPRRPQQQQQHRRRLRRTQAGARWVEILENGEETLSPDQRATSGVRRGSAAVGQQRLGQHQDHSALMDDAALEITNEVQWREAFLYNVGARVLPEGENATVEFDRAFQGNY